MRNSTEEAVAAFFSSLVGFSVASSNIEGVPGTSRSEMPSLDRGIQWRATK